MEMNKRISEMVNGDQIEGFYILKDASVNKASNGSQFLSGNLKDKSGSISMKMWDYAGSFSGSDAGKVVKVRGDVGEYKGTPQLTVAKIRMAQPGEYDLEQLAPTAPIDVVEKLAYVEKFLSSIEDEDYRRVAQAVFDKHKQTFTYIPAAKSVHHSFVSGLLMHTSNMLLLADGISYIYKDVIDRSLLLAGTFLHDIAKEREFAVSELGLVTDYTAEGRLLGHLYMGAQEVAQIAEREAVPKEKAVLLQHMILSHHGKPEYGAVVYPQCAEAELLSQIDMMDSRMELYAETLQNIQPGEFSVGRVFGLDHKVFNHG